MKRFPKKIGFILLLAIFATGGCEKQEDFHVSNLNHDVIMVLGHAGMGEFYKYPNNSWESIEPALGIGADGVEIDIQMTKDSVLILFHDETLDLRTKCGGYTSPYDYNWSEIKVHSPSPAHDESLSCRKDAVTTESPAPGISRTARR